MKAHIILSFCTALVYCASCSNETEQIIEPQAPQLNVNDSLAIVDIWEKADGKNWKNKWDLSDVSTWIGAELNLDEEKNEYRIIGLDINTPEGYNIKGIVSPRIGELTNLRRLGIVNLGIRGKIPASIQNLEQLYSLSICNTSISDTLPDYIFKMKNLEHINIADNQFIDGKLPTSIANSSQQMDRLLLNNNALSGDIPLGIKANIVVLDNNNFEKYPFEYLQENMPVMSLRGNRIHGLIPDSILNSPKLLFKLKLGTPDQQEWYGFDNAPEDWK